jgi:aerobic-type carbon monoxide dehydrogenase small subunit (CoxS/CutS family)
MSEKINLVVNGNQFTVEIEGWEKLLDVLRDKLKLTGTKRGCDDGSCGACTVILNGSPVKSCLYPASKLEGAEILTIESLSNGYHINLIQRALIDSGAVQCGFCTPGIIMELKALFDKDIDADEDKILNSLDKHLCRCTGYESIVDGAKLAQKYLKENK